MLPGDYIAGFVDGEGCFSLRLHKDIKRNRPGSPTYLFWKAEFCIFMRIDDKLILEEIKETLDCGKVYTTKKFARYSVQDTREMLDKIIPFFIKYPLRAKKKLDFDIWLKGVKTIANNRGRSVGRVYKQDSEYYKELSNISNLLNTSRALNTILY